jgi:DNA-binding XRE family transcriptional regulator
LHDPIPRLKAELRQAILADVGRLNQLVAAHMLGVDQARMSNIELGKHSPSARECMPAKMLLPKLAIGP